jgi:hypothetical protein
MNSISSHVQSLAQEQTGTSVLEEPAASMFTVKMEAASSSETLVPIFETMQYHIHAENDLKKYCDMKYAPYD